MDGLALAPLAQTRNARLLIYTDDDPDVGRKSDPLCRLLGRWSGRARRTPLRLRIDDLQGRHVRAIDDAGPLVEIELPAGTYHVIAEGGTARRFYTMALEQGTSFDLHLHFDREED